MWHLSFWILPWKCFMASNKKEATSLQMTLPFYLSCPKTLNDLQPLCVFSLIKIINVVKTNRPFLCPSCPVRKWVVSNYQMFISCQGYCMFCDGYQHTGDCCRQAPKKTESLAWAGIKHIWPASTYTQQRQPVHPRQVELRSLLSLLCILSAQLTLPSKLIQPLGCCQECCSATELKKISFFVLVLCPLSADWLLFSLTPVLRT